MATAPAVATIRRHGSSGPRETRVGTRRYLPQTQPGVGEARGGDSRRAGERRDVPVARHRRRPGRREPLMGTLVGLVRLLLHLTTDCGWTQLAAAATTGSPGGCHDD